MLVFTPVPYVLVHVRKGFADAPGTPYDNQPFDPWKKGMPLVVLTSGGPDFHWFCAVASSLCRLERYAFKSYPSRVQYGPPAATVRVKVNGCWELYRAAKPAWDAVRWGASRAVGGQGAPTDERLRMALMQAGWPSEWKI